MLQCAIDFYFDVGTNSGLDVLPCVAVCCNMLQCVAVCCSVLQCHFADVGTAVFSAHTFCVCGA